MATDTRQLDAQRRDTRRRRQAPTAWARHATGGLALLTLGSLACSGLTGEGELPSDVPDPASVQTPAGAVDAYRAGLFLLQDAVNEVMYWGGLLTDELTLLGAPVGLSYGKTAIDIRQLASSNVGGYTVLHQVRGQAQEARGLLRDFAPDASPALTGHLYTMEGYAEVYLADLHCSGIPLSTVDYDGDYTLRPGSSTRAVYEHALALFDTALPLAGDSASIRHLTAVGRGRALVALGLYAEAAAAVAAVPNDYQYQFQYRNIGTFPVLELWEEVRLFNLKPLEAEHIVATVPENPEGINGLDYRASGDPRTATRFLSSTGIPTTTGMPKKNKYGYTLYVPAKYLPLNGPVPVTVASGVEARLIEAEAALQAGSADWLTKLNALRTDGTFDTQPNAQDPAQTDTLWHAGSGGVAGLRPLEDPGSVDARVDLLFRERAFWLYLTGQRQGDLRRLIRQYGRPEHTVYPTGAGYPGGSGIYGTDVTFPVPEAERTFNSLYTGCINRNA